MKVVKKRSIVLSHVFLMIGALIMLYPLVFALLGMFVSAESFYEVGFLPKPEGFGYFWDNLLLLLRRDEIWPAMFITLGRFAWYVFILSVTSVFGGYAFAKINFKFKELAFYVLMSSMMIPGAALLVPQYLMFSRFPLVGGNNIWGVGGSGFNGNVIVLFITGCFSAYNIFLVRQALAGIGNEYKEAAEIDGAGFFSVVLSIYLPMLKPVLAVIAIQTFIGQWNDYTFPMLYLSGSPEALPIGVVAVRIQNDYLKTAGANGLMNYPMVMFMGVFMMIPPVVVFMIFQKSFVEGMTVGGVKS